MTKKVASKTEKCPENGKFNVKTRSIKAKKNNYLKRKTKNILNF